MALRAGVVLTFLGTAFAFVGGLAVALVPSPWRFWAAAAAGFVAFRCWDAGVARLCAACQQVRWQELQGEQGHGNATSAGVASSTPGGR